jgi:hypothetical protein
MLECDVAKYTPACKSNGKSYSSKFVRWRTNPNVVAAYCAECLDYVLHNPHYIAINRAVLVSQEEYVHYLINKEITTHV